MSSDQLARIIIWVVLFLVVAGPVHEFSHAYTAWRLGDGTAKLFGRVSLNPIVHFDPVGGLLLAASAFLTYGQFGFGWAKPTPVNSYNLRGRYGDSLVALAGPVSNLILAAIFAAVMRLVASLSSDVFIVPGIGWGYERTAVGLLGLVCYTGVVLNVVLAIFNLIPIPPLDGSHVLFDVLNPRTAREIRPYLDQYGLFILILLMFPIGGGSILSRIFDTIGQPIINVLVGI